MWRLSGAIRTIRSRISPSGMRTTRRVSRRSKAACSGVIAVPQLATEEQRSYTAEMLADRRASDEGREGMSAFLEKRKPDWQS